MVKKIVTAIMILCFIFSGANLYAEDLDLRDFNVTVNVNKIPQDFPYDSRPYINQDSRTMIPVRFISERYGCNVEWKDGIVEIKQGTEKIITLKVREKKATVQNNGLTTEIELDTSLVLTEGRTFAPLRFVSETLGGKVEWSGEFKTVSIFDEKIPKSDKRLFDLILATGEFEPHEFIPDRIVPKDKKVEMEIQKMPAGEIIHNDGTVEYTYQSDFTIFLNYPDLYTRNKTKEILKLVFPLTHTKIYTNLMMVLREEAWEGSMMGPARSGYFENRGVGIGKNGMKALIGVKMDGVYFEPYSGPVYPGGKKSSNYDKQVEWLQLNEW